MDLSRKREFADYRSQSSSKRSEITSLRSSHASFASIPSQACFNCVNTYMADHRKRKLEKEKKQEQIQVNKSLRMTSEYKDPQNQYRKELKQQALEHNASMIEEHKQKHRKEIEEDQLYARKVDEEVEQAEKIYKSQIQEQRRRERQFYKQLKWQYDQALEKRDKQKFKHSEEEDSEGLPLYNLNRKQQILKYQKQLLNQIRNKDQQRKHQKQQNEELQRLKNKEFEIQAEKYHHDNVELGNKKNPYLYTQVKEVQATRDKKIKDERRKNNEQRIEMIRRDNEERSRAMKLKMAQMESYVHELKTQVLQKEEKMRESRFEEAVFMERMPKSTEQVKSETLIKKECKGCHKSYPIDFIGRVPKA